MNSRDSASENRFWQVVLQLAYSTPIVTLVVAAIAIGLGLAPSWDAAMSLQREGLARGQFWRVATGHLTHWNADHLLWDVVMFVVLSSIVESRRRESAVWLLIGSGMLISLSLWYAAPEVHEYRGLSGLDSALFAYVAVVLARDALTARRQALAGLIGLLLAGFVGKILYELATGATLFVDSRSAGFTPLPLVHIVGAAAGMAFAAFESRQQTRRALPDVRGQSRIPITCPRLGCRAGQQAVRFQSPRVRQAPEGAGKQAVQSDQTARWSVTSADR